MGASRDATTHVHRSVPVDCEVPSATPRRAWPTVEESRFGNIVLNRRIRCNTSVRSVDQFERSGESPHPDLVERHDYYASRTA
jgi:hypothetical protein